MYACPVVHMHTRMCVYDVYEHVCIVSVFVFICMYLCVHVCMYVCMHVCHACVHVGMICNIL